MSRRSSRYALLFVVVLAATCLGAWAGGPSIASAASARFTCFGAAMAFPNAPTIHLFLSRRGRFATPPAKTTRAPEQWNPKFAPPVRIACRGFERGMVPAGFLDAHGQPLPLIQAGIGWLTGQLRAAMLAGMDTRGQPKPGAHKPHIGHRRRRKRKGSEGVSIPIVIAIVIVVIWGAIILFLITRREGTER